MRDTRRAIAQLRAELNGQVITPDDKSYDQARAVFYGSIDRRPAVIVRPADAAQSLASSRSHATKRAGAGSPQRRPQPCGTQRLRGRNRARPSDLRALEIDPEARTAWAQTGLTAADFGRGRRPPAGDRFRRHRLGRHRRTDARRRHRVPRPEARAHDRQPARRGGGNRRRRGRQHRRRDHPDLFWAIRGGGGNFGVATRFQFRLHDLETIVGGMLILPATPEVVSGSWRRRRRRRS